ncbi:hypothetical protein [Coleofasciculus sp. G2-EDA-02]|uniref:hypothetical protein n=1 Tax=Coleofasciculus sp. G2-EDA-02 TaxID=3069529 RepID=UPI0032F695DA
MKLAIRVVLLLSSLLALGTRGDRADATPTQCSQIRQVRRLAIQQGLDDANLATLEAQYCNTAQPSAVEVIPPPTATQECLDLTIMTRLARMSQGNSNLVRLVETQQQFACGLANTWGRAIIEYPNGQRAKIGDNWNYPNGQTAKFGAIWKYPNGQTAKVASRWYYPNGEIAKFGTRWSYPTGESANFENLVTWACSVISRDECASRLLALRNTNDFWSEMATLELAWQAYSKSIVGAGLGTKVSYSEINEPQNPPYLKSVPFLYISLFHDK